LLNSAIRKKRRQRLSVLSMLAIYGAISVGLVANYSAARTAARWFVWSHDYKAQVLAQPASAKGDLKHIDWDGWGMFAQNTYVFLVFDATDSLSVAAMTHQPGKFNGIPCEVLLLRRLESQWYSVRFYMREYWGQRNALDCRPGFED
jgi:hypothetical protein